MGDLMTSREEKNKKYVDEINREKTIKITKIILKILFVIITIFALIFLYAKFYETNQLETREYVIKDVLIPEEFNGIKVLHFTDILYGSITKNNLSKINEEVKLINPDIVLFTGNIISKEYQVNEEEIKLLNDFFKSIPYTIGKYAVSGDSDNQNFHLIMENTDFTIINNELLTIYNGMGKIDLIGINYDSQIGIKNNDDFTITIINNYDDYYKYNITSNYVFAGHNLGGEIKLFGLPLLGLDEHLNSYYIDNSTTVYISNGLGSIHNLRLMNKPSMNVYRLYNR